MKWLNEEYEEYENNRYYSALCSNCQFIATFVGQYQSITNIARVVVKKPKRKKRKWKKMYYKNMWYSESEMVAYCNRLNETIKNLKSGCNDLEIIHDYFISVYKHYTTNKNDCISDIAKLTSKIKNENDCTLKYYLEMERETIIEKLHYYTAVLTFVNGTLKLIDKELHKIK